MQRLFFRVSLGIIAIWAVGLAYVTLFSENQLPDYSKDDGRITIVATMYPLAFLASGLDPIADVVTIVGPGTEPHDFEPTIRDVQTMRDAELLLVNRGDVDEWAMNVVSDRDAPTLSALDSLGLPEIDPHFWLDPAYAEQFVRDIGYQLELLDPLHAESIRENVEKKIAELRHIDAAYRAKLQNCEIPEVVTAHEAFHFLANAYGFTAHGVTGINPEEEPSAAAVAAMVDLVRTRQITTVYFEELASDELAKTIALETGAISDVLDPIESLTPGHDVSTGYTEIMLSNLEKLSVAMVCRP